MAFPLIIFGKYGWEKVVTSAKKHPLGTRMELRDGRVFYYAFSDGAIGAGQLVMEGDVVTATHERGRAVAAAALGTKAIVVTNSGAALAKDKYADGTIYITDGAAEGHMYIIKSHPAAATTATFKITIDEEDGIQDEALSTTSKVGLRLNKWLDAELFDSNDIDGIPLGVAPVEVADDRYFWCQTWGSAQILMIAQTAIKGYLARIYATGTVDGGVRMHKTASAQATDTLIPNIGIFESAATATGYAHIFLTLAR